MPLVNKALARLSIRVVIPSKGVYILKRLRATRSLPNLWLLIVIYLFISKFPFLISEPGVAYLTSLQATAKDDPPRFFFIHSTLRAFIRTSNCSTVRLRSNECKFRTKLRCTLHKSKFNYKLTKEERMFSMMSITTCSLTYMHVLPIDIPNLWNVHWLEATAVGTAIVWRTSFGWCTCRMRAYCHAWRIRCVTDASEAGSRTAISTAIDFVGAAANAVDGLFTLVTA